MSSAAAAVEWYSPELDDADFISAQHEGNESKFRLSSKFLERFKHKRAPFGFNGLGELVYQRTYSRPMEGGRKELWHETVERVVNGTYEMQRRWIQQHQLGWNAWTAQKSAQV